MIPPQEINVLEKHGGFTAITPAIGYKKEITIPNTDNWRWKRCMCYENTLWRPASVLKKGTIGKLVSYDEGSFYQNNNNVTMARYKVPGYRYQVAAWFDNETGERIA